MIEAKLSELDYTELFSLAQSKILETKKENSKYQSTKSPHQTSLLWVGITGRVTVVTATTNPGQPPGHNWDYLPWYSSHFLTGHQKWVTFFPKFTFVHRVGRQAYLQLQPMSFSDLIYHAKPNKMLKSVQCL